MAVKEYIMDLAGRIGLAQEAAEYALSIAETLDGSALLDEVWQSICSEDFKVRRDAMGLMRETAAECGCELYRVSLAAALLLTRNMKDLYAKEGYDEQIYWDSLQDIAIWAKCCKDETGRWGMKQFHWLAKTLSGKLWRLGRMQFELSRFEEGHYEKDGVVIHDGDIVINTHIPEGEPLTPEKRTDAFDRAVKFFGRNVFMCESWMLWPAHYEMLKPTSNVISFMNDFDIFHSFEQPGVSDLWRIFGYRDDYRPEKLPANSSMQRGYIEQMKKNGGLTGGGYGIHVHKAK